MRKTGKFCAASNDIPIDVLVQKIFYKLPVRSLIRFSCVSKLWFNLIANNQQLNKFHFVESQKNPILIFSFEDYYQNRISYYLEKEEHGKLHVYQKENYTHTYEIGYCNGLACSMTAHSYDGEWTYISLEICNHCRREKLITASRLKSRVGELIFGFQFGYNDSNNEYKVICIMQYKDEYDYYIFTLGSNEPWRKIYNPWPKQRPLRFEISVASSTRSVPPISCNGTLFYEMEKDTTEIDMYESLALVALDLHGETYRIIELPGDDEFVSNHNRRPHDFYTLEYKGCLCYSRMEKTDPFEGKVVLFILKDTTKHVWCKETIKLILPRELNNPAHPVGTSILIFSNQVILYWRLYTEENGHSIQLYNVHLKELKEVNFPKEGCEDWYDYYVSSHVENFFSLKTLVTMTEVGNTREVLKEYKKISNLKRLFKDIPTGNPAVISYLDPL